MLAKIRKLREFALVGASSKTEREQVMKLANELEADLNQTASTLAKMTAALRRLKGVAATCQEG